MGTRTVARGALAPIVAAGVLGAAPALACNTDMDCAPLSTCTNNTCQAIDFSHTGPVTRDGAALGFSIAGITVSVLGLLVGSKTWDVAWKGITTKAGYDSRTEQIILYSLGSLQMVLGGLAVGLQASVPDAPCGFKSDCQVTYGLGGTTLALGATWTVAGIYLSAIAAQSVRYRAWLVPVPMAIPTQHGVAPGLGISGINF